jgi:hypothetical protein
VTGRAGYGQAKRDWAALERMLNGNLIERIAERMQLDGPIFARPTPALADPPIPARITLDGSLPSCRPLARPFWRATPTPAAPAATTRETSTMTSTYEPTPEQAERNWALRAARDILTTTQGGGFLATPAKRLDAMPEDLVEMAAFIIGSKEVGAADPADDQSAEQIVHNLIHELDGKQAKDVVMHAVQHAGVPLVVAVELGALADLPDEDIHQTINEALEGLSGTFERVVAYRERNAATAKSIDDFLGDLFQKITDEEHVVKVDEGSLTVDKAEGEEPTDTKPLEDMTAAGEYLKKDDAEPASEETTDRG